VIKGAEGRLVFRAYRVLPLPDSHTTKSSYPYENMGKLLSDLLGTRRRRARVASGAAKHRRLCAANSLQRNRWQPGTNTYETNPKATAMITKALREIGFVRPKTLPQRAASHPPEPSSPIADFGAGAENLAHRLFPRI
jgi:hypothetical protein